ncbi:ankyrin-3-like isoform X2 [Haliotis rufescens]|uniref:ankyrin-3-like isoform X2 n=1 Tax=Haliotis rufescens TaxID=6454 RepID=UPI00201F38D9|nr:ankyrin-3-like isoform X2 [Haliotis rufescens]
MWLPRSVFITSSHHYSPPCGCQGQPSSLPPLHLAAKVSLHHFLPPLLPSIWLPRSPSITSSHHYSPPCGCQGQPSSFPPLHVAAKVSLHHILPPLLPTITPLHVAAKVSLHHFLPPLLPSIWLPRSVFIISSPLFGCQGQSSSFPPTITPLHVAAKVSLHHFLPSIWLPRSVIITSSHHYSPPFGCQGQSSSLPPTITPLHVAAKVSLHHFLPSVWLPRSVIITSSHHYSPPCGCQGQSSSLPPTITPLHVAAKVSLHHFLPPLLPSMWLPRSVIITSSHHYSPPCGCQGQSSSLPPTITPLHVAAKVSHHHFLPPLLPSMWLPRSAFITSSPLFGCQGQSSSLPPTITPLHVAAKVSLHHFLPPLLPSMWLPRSVIITSSHHYSPPCGCQGQSSSLPPTITPLHVAAKVSHHHFLPPLLPSMWLPRSVIITSSHHYSPPFGCQGQSSSLPPTITPLHVAAKEGQDAIVGHLLRRGADVHLLDTSLRSALHIASGGQHAGCVELLLKHGAGDSQDKHGQTARHMARKDGVKQVFRKYLDHIT